jgi:ADP-ribose pyrophosphatase YjhB (NUDIX family)
MRNVYKVSRVSSGGYLSEEDYERARQLVPISCVDVLPYRMAKGLEVGLIKRLVPTKTGDWTSGWALVGGRVYRGETLEVALRRHIETTLGPRVEWDPNVDWDHPVVVGQYLPEPVEGSSFDPRQHSIAVTYAVTLDGSPKPQGEAEDFRWFPSDALPADQEIGFDQARVVHAAIDGLIALGRHT